MDLSSNWGICSIAMAGAKVLALTLQTVSLFLIVIEKLTKIAKIHKKTKLSNLTAFRALRLTKAINLNNSAPLYF
jgi:hypothetical protein